MINISELLRQLSHQENVTEEYKKFVADHVAELKPGFSVKTYARFGLKSELGEVYDLLAKEMRQSKPPIDPERLWDELSDVLYYSVLLGSMSFVEDDIEGLMRNCQRFDFPADSLADLCEYNMRKLNNRRKETGSHLK